MANTWGTNSWGVNSFGAQDDVTLTLTGLSATSSIGSTTQEAGASASPTGSQLTFTNAGAIAGSSVDVLLTGIQLTFSPGDEVIGIGVNVTGSQSTTSIGTATVDETTLTGEGWGRDAWGSFAWGDNYSVALNGISLTSSIGEETAFTDVAVDVTGSELTTTFANPSFSIQIDQDIFVLASEDQLDGFVGSLTFQADANVTVTSAGQLTGSVGNAEAGLLLEVPVTGIELTSTIGTIALQQSTNEPATGQELTTSLGTAEEIPTQIVGVTGIELTGSVGSVTVVGTSVVQPTGILATISAGQANVTSWQEIDPGVTNVWTEVDLAA